MQRRGSPEGAARTASGTITLLAAGAGSGKTHRLTQVVTSAVDPMSADPIALESLVAVTYTRKAAAELEARIRRTLIEAAEPCQELPLAYIGTVHSVCLRLLREFALDAGLSPLLDVVPGEEAQALRQALDAGLPPALRRRLGALAARLEVGWDARVRRHDWLGPVQEIMTLARSNRIAASALAQMAERSSQRLRELLGAPEADAEALDAELAAALASAERDLAALDSRQKNTRAALRDVRADRKELARGRLPWARWVALQKIDAGKPGRVAVAPVVAVAARVDRHPRLHAELHEFTLAAYEAARIGLSAYETWKRERRLIDFVDMVDQTLGLLGHPGVREELAQRLSLCVVDEFQDTSPLQLALFVRLHELAQRSVWVGDRKQCIFEYAGADPALMEAVTRWLREAGGVTEPLLANWRSRPELVQALSGMFSAAFGRHGYLREEVAMLPQRSVPQELAGQPPLGIWYSRATNKEAHAEALANGIRKLVDQPADTLVVDRRTGQPRPLRAGDVAVLVATNAEAEQLAAALARRGVRAALARSGLLDTPEGVLVSAALAYLLDRRDELACAQIEALTGFGALGPDAWLERSLTREAERRWARERGDAREELLGGAAGEPTLRSERVQRLDGLRVELEVLSPSEALDRVLFVLDVAALGARWPDPEQRLANLDALRALASRYETGCRHRREAASVAGLLRFFADSRRTARVQGEERASDEQHRSQGSGCVTVTTYHRAKGLEWPVVVLASLERTERRDAFSVLPESDRPGFDPSDPLGGRWIRYWPWPFGGQRKARLGDTVAASPEGRAVHEREARERLRLLYVGFTRARDHLVLALRAAKGVVSAAWLDELCDEAGAPLIELPAPPSTDDVAPVRLRGSGGATSISRARVWTLSDEAADTAPREPPRSIRWFSGAERGSPALPDYRIAPSQAAVSQAAADGPQPEGGRAGQAHRIGARLPLGSERPKDWSRVGDALHAFLAADLPGLSEPQRHERARRLLGAANLLLLLEPAALVRAADQWRGWVNARWPGAVWHRELPVTGVIATEQGQRRIEGTIDLLLEVEGGVVLVDYKSYPGRQETWREKALEYAPQLAAYAEVLRMAGRRVSSRWISFPVAGGAVEIVAPPPALETGAAGGGER